MAVSVGRDGVKVAIGIVCVDVGGIGLGVGTGSLDGEQAYSPARSVRRIVFSIVA